MLLRLEARAMLDDPEPTLTKAAAAAAAGDESWQRWVDEHDRGEALVVRLEVRLEFSAGRPEAVEVANTEAVEVANTGLFVEKHRDPPRVEQQISEMVSKDFALLACELRERGHEVSEADLSELYVHVELDDELRAAVMGSPRPSHAASRDAPAADARMSGRERPSAQ